MGDESNDQSDKQKCGIILMNKKNSKSSGIWNMQVCLRDNFYSGTMLPQLEWAQSKQYPVLIMNPIKDEKNSKKHIQQVWDEHIKTCSLNKLYLISL